jgi:hypothetical protein
LAGRRGGGLTKPQRLQWQPTPKQEARWMDVLARSVGRPWRSLATHSRRRASLLPFSGWTRRGPARSPSTWLGSSIRTCCGERVAGLASVSRAMLREERRGGGSSSRRWVEREEKGRVGGEGRGEWEMRSSNASDGRPEGRVPQPSRSALATFDHPFFSRDQTTTRSQFLSCRPRLQELGLAPV